MELETALLFCELMLGPRPRPRGERTKGSMQQWRDFYRNFLLISAPFDSGLEFLVLRG
jgi:hypothetical protein